MGVFIIKGLLDVCRRGLVVFVVFAKGFVVGDGGVEGFTSGKGGLELRTLFSCFSVAEGESTAVEVVSPLASLSSLYYVSGGPDERS